MHLSLVVLHLAGAVMLLLWAVRMVRTGFERAAGTSMREALRAALSRGERKVGRWAAEQGAGVVCWDQPPDPFFNVNTPQDLAQAEARA